MPDLAVVVPAFNEERLIVSCLESLAGQDDHSFHLVVVARHEGAVHFVEAAAPAKK